MLDKIMEQLGGGVAEQIAGKAGVSLDQAKGMLPFAQESLQEGLMSQVTGGNVSGLLGMFQGASGGGGGLMDNPIFASIKGMFMKKVMTNMGLPESVAGLAAGTGMSSLIGGLAGKMVSHGDTDDIDAGSLMSVLGVGGDAGGMLGKAAGMLGGLTGGGGNDSPMDAAKDLLGGLMGGGDDKKDDNDSPLDQAKDLLGGIFGK
ncbi:MAG: hypothetical protein AB8H03_15065 [Saprospiraceae bacterium]